MSALEKAANAVFDETCGWQMPRTIHAILPAFASSWALLSEKSHLGGELDAADEGAAPSIDDVEVTGQCGGNNDRPAVQDSLGYTPLVKGAAQFLLHSETAATTLAVYGSWGSGKSTFMKLVEAEMLLHEAAVQLRPMPDGADGALHSKYYDMKTQHEQGQLLKAADWQQLQALASPRLLTVWFNSWQYLTQTEVWSGLVVEITQRLESKLGSTQRRSMRQWFTLSSSPLAFICLCLTPMQLCAAFAYNWHTRRGAVLLRCVLPLLLVLTIVVACMAIGIWEINAQYDRRVAAAGTPVTSPAPANSTVQPRDRSVPASNATLWSEQLAHKGGMAAVAVVGVVTALLAGIVAGITNCKQISDGMVEGYSYMKFKDHSDKIGYQHAVIKDLQLLGKLLRKRLTKFQRVSGDKDHRIVVLIDDLDRCKPSSIIEVLEAINLVLADSGITVVVGMDKHFVLSGIQNAYKDIKVMQSSAKAEEFLQKIVQVELTLPTPPQKDIRTYLSAQGIKLAAAQVELSVDPFADLDHSNMLKQQHMERQKYSASAQQQLKKKQELQQQQPQQRQQRGVLGEIVPQMAPLAGVAAAILPQQQPSADTHASSVSDQTQLNHAASMQNAAKAAEEAAKALQRVRLAAATARKAAAAADQLRPGSPESLLADTAARKAQAKANEVCLLKSSADTANDTVQVDAATADQNTQEAQEAAAAASKLAEEAAHLSKEAASHAAAARIRATGKKQGLSTAESEALQLLLSYQLLTDATPREIKRLLNRYLLSKFCCMERESQEARAHTRFSKERQLLAWVFLWWRCPRAMRAVTKVKPKNAEQELPNLVQLVQQLLQGEASSSGSGHGGASSSNNSSSSSSYGGAGSSTGRASAGAGQQQTPQQEALKTLRRAEAALKEAQGQKTAVAGSSSSSSSSSSSGDAKDKEANKAAEASVEAAELRVELAKIWVLGCNARQQLTDFFNLPWDLMQMFRPFGM